MPVISPDLRSLLKRTFGYGEFRPLQREIIERRRGRSDSFGEALDKETAQIRLF